MKAFTVEELAKFDGRDGRAAYVAYEGRVYDVTESSMWIHGDHEGMHQAGADMTDDHDDAPHEPHVTAFPEVGELT